MTRKEVEAIYDIDSNGVIKSLGKFERESAYVPYYWDMALQGMFSEDVAGVFFIPFDNEDFQTWPELRGQYGIGLEESDTGFVYSTLFGTQADYNKSVERCEAIEASESEQDSTED